ncbi:hypothetical protein [uncultured Cohaesibacter sp.]|uniref:hypothetical protein n=1 Tax=uncultured Cohaesibacter sp. TaxID=1002546 RepID=UPI00292D8631|nr:hypothetical protein [uncultured Cohaesibacter sp.]
MRQNVFVIVFILTIFMLMILAQQFESTALMGLAFLLLSGAGLDRGLAAMRSGYDLDGDSYTNLYSTKRGWAARISGFNLCLSSLVFAFIAITLVFDAGELVVALLKPNMGLVIGFGGLWLAIAGIGRTLGDEEGKRWDGVDTIFRLFARLTGPILILAGGVMMLGGWIGFLPLIGRIR